MNINAAEYKSRSIELAKISAPIIVEQVFITAMGMVNTAMIASAGDYAVAAVGMIDVVSNLIIALFAALTTGGAIVVARYFGRNDRAGAAEAGAQSSMLALALALVIWALFASLRKPIVSALFGASEPDVLSAGMNFFRIVNYSFPPLAVTQTLFGVMRGCGDTGAPMFITLGMNFVNFVLGWVLIIGINIFGLRTPGFGVTGAAFALSLARLCGMAASVVYIARLSKGIRLNKASYFKFNFKLWKDILGLGVPTSVESTLFQAGKLITQIFIVGMGAAAQAANAVASIIAGFINVPGSAFSMGVMILVGHRMGRGDESDVTKTSVFAIVAGAAMLAVICAAVAPFVGAFTTIYNMSPGAAKMFRAIMASCLIATPFFWPASFIAPASLRAAGDVKFTMLVAVISMWAFRIVSGYILGIVMGMGILGVWLAMYMDWVVRSVMFSWRLLSNKWKKVGI